MREITRRKITSYGLVSIPVLWMVVFLFIPYIVMFAYSFYLKTYPTFVPAFVFDNYVTVISDPQYFQVFLRTSKIAIAVAISALLIA